MTKILNRPETFRADFIDGYLAAHPEVERVPRASAIMRRSGPELGRVAVVVGGGGGHFPAFAGLVGDGVATAAVIGEVFTSPSAEQILRTILTVDAGRGVVVCIGNYNGDVMNFGLAARRAEREGVAVRIVAFTDDVASAPPDEVESRRGIAGGWFVLRSIAAVAATGAPLDEVEAAGRHANERTRSFGVAFGGCTLPGSAGPLVALEPGTMGIGLGIHGEPGVGIGPAMPARELAQLLVERLLDEQRPAGATACAVLVNGLGATSVEELYVLFGAVDAALRAAQVVPEVVEVDQVVTSLDMPGCSLTICWLDDDLRARLRHPVRTPALVRGDR